MYIVDARGLSCPEPLMMTQEALKSQGSGEIKVLVDEAHSRTNVEKFAKSKGRTVETVTEEDHFAVLIK